MKVKRKLILLLIVVIVVFITACSDTSDKELNTTGNEMQENDVEETEGVTEEADLTVTDHLGRTVSLEKPAEKIVSGYYISTSTLISLELEDKIVGVEAKASSRPIYSLAAPQILELPNVGTAKEFNLEGCVELNPDLVILPIKLKDQIKTLEDLGIKAIGVNPENKELLFETITMIGKLTGVKYEDLLNYYTEKEIELKEVHKDIAEKPKVYLAGNSSMLSTATANMYQNDLIETAGGVNVAGNIDDTYWVDISYEQLVEYNPDYIIIAPEADYTKEDVVNDPNLSMISAVINDKVYQMPSTFEAWDSPVPSSILGKIWLTSILYGDKYPYENFINETSEFYKTFYDFEVNTEALKLND